MNDWGRGIDVAQLKDEESWASPQGALSDAEGNRLAAVRSSGFHAFGTSDFQDLLVLAASICGTTIGLVNLVEEDRLWVKGAMGFAADVLPRATSFCTHVLHQEDLFLVEDARLDARFADAPQVVDDPQVRFYAGVNIRWQNECIGTLCVLDVAPRVLSEAQKKALLVLARQAEERIELRAQKAVLEVSLLQNQRLTTELTASLDDNRREQLRLANIIEATHAATWEWNVQTGQLLVNDRFAQMLCVDKEKLELQGISALQGRHHPEDVVSCRAELELHFRELTPCFEFEWRLRDQKREWRWVADKGSVISRTADGAPEWMFGTRIEITERKRYEENLRKSKDFLDRTGRVAGVGGWELDLLTNEVTWSPETHRIHGVTEHYEPSIETGIAFYTPESRRVLLSALERAIRAEDGWDLELQLNRQDGQRIWVRVTGAVTQEKGRAARLTGAIQDITEARRLTAELAEQHELLQVTLQSIGDAVMTTDAHGVITWLNPVAERLTGWSSREAMGVAAAEVFHLLHAKTRVRCPSPIDECLRRGEMVGLKHDAILVARDGREFGIEDSASPIRSTQGEVLGAVLVFHDVTEQRRMSSELQYRAAHDALTGLPNRADFETRLSQLLMKTKREGSHSALLFIDLDQFKIVNDSCGHSAGDELLQRVAKVLTSAVRANDTVARLGGDEFGVLLDHCPEAQASAMAERICNAVEEFRFLQEDMHFRVGVSIGLVPITSQWSDKTELMKAADSACYAAKEAGRNRIHRWAPVDAAAVDRHAAMRWATRLESALEEGQFKLYVQQYVPLHPETAGMHAEVLLRMNDPLSGLIYPGAFLSAAERFQLISRIDQWVLSEVLSLLRRADAEPLAQLVYLNVNLSGQSVSDEAFHQWALQALAEVPFSVRRRLCFEIAESAAVTNLSRATRFLESLRELDVKVALDDFGAGAAWFGYLTKLPVDFIKIDGQFVRDLTANELSQVAVRCFADVARTLRVQTIAKWVETEEVCELLGDIGIDFVQGYLLHKPVPFEEMWAELSIRGAREQAVLLEKT